MHVLQFFDGSVSSGDMSAGNAGAMLMTTYNSYGGSPGSESRSASPSHLPPRKRHYDQQQFDSATSSLAASGNNTPLTNIVYQ
ncbi:hypothetical protein Ciccas_009579 [Cichlidogyrus casuarinus]|uniref:Uncharacterized protein n=1 Tax=Cichlidogyrus casuarinus TaxID=1844966 RepID=A0ABD2PWL7_9PLAT